MTRKEALRILDMLWDADTDIGARLLRDVVANLGYAKALTDKALIDLAHRQQGEDQAQAAHALARQRNEV